MAAAPGERQRPVELLAEEGPIRQAGQSIVTRKVTDLGFRVLPLGNVFHQHHRAAVLDGMEGERERAPVASFDRQIAVDVAREIAVEIGGNTLHRGRRDDAGAGALAQELAKRQTLARALGRDAEEFGKTLISHQHALLGIQHAEAVRHIVERRIEPRSKQRDIPRRTDRIEQGLPQSVGHELEAKKKRNEHEDKRGMIGLAAEEQGGAHRGAGADNLRRHETIARKISTGYSDHIGDAGGKTKQMNDRICRRDERQKDPRTQQQIEDCRTNRVTRFPFPRAVSRRERRSDFPEIADFEGARACKKQKGGRTPEQGPLPGFPSGEIGDRRNCRGANKHRPRLAIQRVYQRKVGIRRKFPVGSPHLCRLWRSPHGVWWQRQ